MLPTKKLLLSASFIVSMAAIPAFAAQNDNDSLKSYNSSQGQEVIMTNSPVMDSSGQPETKAAAPQPMADPAAAAMPAPMPPALPEAATPMPETMQAPEPLTAMQPPMAGPAAAPAPAPIFDSAPPAPPAPAAMPAMAAAPTEFVPSANDKPLMVIRFNQDFVRYDTPLSSAVKKAMDVKPGVNFSIVSYYPQSADSDVAAQNMKVAQANGNLLLGKISGLGVSPQQTRISYQAAAVPVNEIHIFAE